MPSSADPWKRTTIIAGFIVLALSICWLLWDPSFESIITTITSLAASTVYLQVQRRRTQQRFDILFAAYLIVVAIAASALVVTRSLPQRNTNLSREQPTNSSAFVPLPAKSFYYEVSRSYTNRIEMERAATPLINKGAIVAIYLVEAGQSDIFDAYLVRDGVQTKPNQMQSNLIAVFVSIDSRYTEIRWGSLWDRQLGANEMGKKVQQDYLVPKLQDGDFTSAFRDTLDALNNAVAGQ